MLFIEGHYYRYTGSKKKPYKNLKCVYADLKTAVMEPYNEGCLTPGDTFALPQDCKSYWLDGEFNGVTHQIRYYEKLRDHYIKDRTILNQELNTKENIIRDLDDIINKLSKGETL